MDDPRAWLQRHVSEVPAQPALTDEHGVWSFAQLDDVVRRMAGGLEEAGIRENARVMLAARKSRLTVALAIACFRNGVGIVPIDPDSPARRLRSMIATATPSLMVTDHPVVAQHAAESGIPIATTEALATGDRADGARPMAAFDPERVAYLMFTSGSSGEPKAVTIPWRALASFYTAILPYYPVKRGARCLNTAPAYFDVAVLDTWFPLFVGAHVRLTQPADLFPPRFLDILSSDRIQFMCCVAPQLKLVAECGSLMDYIDLTSLDTIMTGAESPDPSAMQRWIAAAPKLKLLNGYGPTEATCVCTVYVISRDNVADPVPYPIGRELSDVICRIVVDGRPIDETDQDGELWVAGPQVMQRYFGNDAETQARLVTVDGRIFYRTGDRVRKLPSGDLMYLGRVDEEVKVGGYRINLLELTAWANRHPDVRESFAAAVLSSRTGYRQLALALRLDSDQVDRVIAEVQATLASHLPKYMLPRQIYAFPEFPRLRSGKLDKRALAETLDREVNAA